jgi:sugar (pentulose or hexulose) kinase
MYYIAVDLGTTNIKIVMYDKDLNPISIKSKNVNYSSYENIIEFNPNDYFNTVSLLIKNCIKDAFPHGNKKVKIILTGQAESLIALDKKNKPIRNGISWLDMRSKKECIKLRHIFDERICSKITGQTSIIPAWPITKMLWIRNNEPNIFNNVSKYLMLKDYIQYRLTGKIIGEYSIYNFTHYFDIIKKKYWKDILDYCGIRLEQLPQLVEPFTDIGNVTQEISKKLGINKNSTVNVVL